ncbi:caspase family protein [Lysobacter capsici]|uniref:caspase family protein n=1 Tax=Lysobacter capsici TaxID=435897 RepID=UPI001C000FAD|nr:caspase family protein [Lysobacter capsici]QWF18152.1 caspase family protein [Lysobacter capsici]
MIKRKAILIANTHELLGSAIDIEKIKNFLESDRGGQWRGNEIQSLVNPRKSILQNALQIARSEGNDFVIVHFSGHGGQAVNSVTLELNESKETIQSFELFGIAPRQVSIFDCCRGIERVSVEAAYDSISESRSDIRSRYEARIMIAAPQQLKLYACSKGEFAEESEEGGYYSHSLFQAAIDSPEKYCAFNTAHASAAENVRRMTKQKQNPEIISGRHLGSQNIIISLR